MTELHTSHLLHQQVHVGLHWCGRHLENLSFTCFSIKSKSSTEVIMPDGFKRWKGGQSWLTKRQGLSFYGRKPSSSSAEASKGQHQSLRPTKMLKQMKSRSGPLRISALSSFFVLIDVGEPGFRNQSQSPWLRPLNPESALNPGKSIQ